MRVVLFLAVTLVPSAAIAQHQAAGHQEQPYADLTDRAIKALSAAEVEDLLAGNGMGFALPAELNGYPGPRHVLELREQLELTDEQRAATQALFTRMQASAKELGLKLIDLETRLDQAFAARSIDEATLNHLTTEAGQVRAGIRAEHLRAHLETVKILSPQQLQAYNHARGYRTGH